eukprot:14982611-Alexandrium_andersonii.AAC.1
MVGVEDPDLHRRRRAERLGNVEVGSHGRQPALLDPCKVRRGGGRSVRRANPELTGRRRPGGLTRQ